MLDGDKLFKILTENPELNDIPLIHIVSVAKCVIEAINECIVKEESYV